MLFSSDIKIIRQNIFPDQETFAHAFNFYFTAVNRWEARKSKSSYKAMKLIANCRKTNGIDFNVNRKISEEQ